MGIFDTDPFTMTSLTASINEVTYTIRNIRGEMKVPPGASIDLFIVVVGQKGQENMMIFCWRAFPDPDTECGGFC